jgi:hypothetical protein
MYFIVNGAAAYVLPRFKNKILIDFNKGEHFGHIDLFGIREFEEPLLLQNTSHKPKRKRELIRKFTVLAKGDSELLTLSVPDLDKMRLEFPEYYQELHKGAKERLKSDLKLKKTEFNNCIKESK